MEGGAYDEVGSARVLSTESDLVEVDGSEARVMSHLVTDAPAQVDQLQLDAERQRQSVQLRHSRQFRSFFMSANHAHTRPCSCGTAGSSARSSCLQTTPTSFSPAALADLGFLEGGDFGNPSERSE